MEQVLDRIKTAMKVSLVFVAWGMLFPSPSYMTSLKIYWSMKGVVILSVLNYATLIMASSISSYYWKQSLIKVGGKPPHNLILRGVCVGWGRERQITLRLALK